MLNQTPSKQHFSSYFRSIFRLSTDDLQLHSLLLLTMKKAAIIKWPVPELRESQSSGLRLFMTTRFNTIVSIFRDWFRRTWTKLRGRVVGFPDCLRFLTHTNVTTKKGGGGRSLEATCVLWERKLSRCVWTDADRAVVFGDTIKETRCTKRIILGSRHMNKA